MIPDATAPHPGAQAVPPAGGRIAVVVKGYPRLSETFIAQELLGLQQAGLDFAIVSLRHPTDPAIHDLHREITAPVIYLPEYLHQEVVRVLRGLRWALGRGAHPDFLQELAQREWLVWPRGHFFERTEFRGRGDE